MNVVWSTFSFLRCYSHPTFYSCMLCYAPLNASRTQHTSNYMMFHIKFFHDDLLLFICFCSTVLQNDSPAMKKAVSLLSLTTPNSNRKRRRLRDTLAQLTKETEISPFPPPRKRQSAEHSLSIGSLLDISNTPETCKALTGKRRMMGACEDTCLIQL